MYLSCLLIDVGTNPDRPRPGRAWLRNVYHVHQRLCMAFPSAPRKAADPEFLQPYAPPEFARQQVHAERDAASGFLFRIDPQAGGRAVILVQSAMEPDWSYAFHNARFLLAAAPAVKPLDLSFAAGEALRFCVVANPTRKIDTKSGPDGQRRNGRRVPVRSAELEGWLVRRSEPSGFAVEAGTLAVQAGYAYFNKSPDGPGQQLRRVRYEGLLRVTEPACFRETLLRGIGPGKAFGFGLLSVARSA